MTTLRWIAVIIAALALVSRLKLKQFAFGFSDCGDAIVASRHLFGHTRRCALLGSACRERDFDRRQRQIHALRARMHVANP